MAYINNCNKTLNISDDLDLANVPIPNIPKDIIFPDELNKYLRDQVQYLTHENGMLYKNLSDAETQIKQSSTKINVLHSQLEEYQLMCPKNSLASSSSNLASGKIVELSKKLRERNSELEVFKTKCSKLQQYILNIEKEKENEEEIVPEKPKNELEDLLKVLQDKLNGTTAKLCETRNSNTQLKNDLKLANKLLQQEIGDNFENLQATVNTNSNWRGRAQIICDLQQKNGDLRDKLKVYQEKDKGHVVNEPIQITKWDKRLDSLTKENAELKHNIQDTKRKLEATRARNKVLESEYSVLKAKIGAITEQSDRDHEIITSLTAKLAQSQEIQNEATRQKQVIIHKVEQENKDLQLETSKQVCKMNNLTVQLEEQRREIEILRKKLRNPQSLLPNNTENIDVKTIKLLEAERLRLLELTKLMNDRVESERSSHATTEAKFRLERQRVAKLEAKVARLQLEQQTDMSSSYSSYSLKSKEQDSKSEDRLELLEETLKAMDMRLQIECQEHKSDIEEFSKILRNYGYTENNVDYRGYK